MARITKANYSSECKALTTAKERNAFIIKHYEKTFGNKPTNAWYETANGKMSYAHASATLCVEMGFAPATKGIAKKVEKMTKEDAKPEKKVATKAKAVATKKQTKSANTVEARLSALEKAQKATDKKLDKMLAILEAMN